MRCGSSWNAFPLGANLIGLEMNVCSLRLRVQKGHTQIFSTFVTSYATSVCLILKSTLGSFAWTHPPTCNKRLLLPPPPLIHTPPWITGFSSIRAVLSWLKLYYQEIRESLGDGAMNSLAGQATELGSFWSAFSKTTEVAVCGYLSQRGMVGVVPTKKTREKKSNCKSIPL